MAFLIVKERDAQTSIVRVTSDPNEQVVGRFQSWNLSQGNQIVFVHLKMARLLNPAHVAGSFMSTQAMYAFGYEDLCAIMRSNLGPSDEDRYRSLSHQTGASPRRPINWHMVTGLLVGLTGLVMTIVGGLIQFGLVMVLVPFLISWIKRK